MKLLIRISIAVIGILFVVLIIYSCLNTDNLRFWHYSISENGDEWVVQIRDTVPDYDHLVASYDYFVEPPTWNSFKELREELLTGSIDQQKLAYIRRSNYGRDPISLPNLLSISDIQLPKDCKSMRLSCGEFGFSVKGAITSQTSQTSLDGHPHLFFYLITKDEWSRTYKSAWEYYRKIADSTVSSQKVNYRNAKETVFFSYGRKYRVVEYTISDGTKTLHIQEEHADAFRYPGSDYVEPAKIDLLILGEQDGFYYQVLYFDISEVPSEDWLLQFGIQKASKAERILPFVMPIVAFVLICLTVVLFICLVVLCIKRIRQKKQPAEQLQNP